MQPCYFWGEKEVKVIINLFRQVMFELCLELMDRTFEQCSSSSVKILQVRDMHGLSTLKNGIFIFMRYFGLHFEVQLPEMNYPAVSIGYIRYTSLKAAGLWEC